MSDAQLRPRYRYLSDLTKEEMRVRIISALKDPEVNLKQLQQRSVDHHLVLVYPRRHKHFWSPVMDINIEPRSDKKSLIRVLIGPEPSIWTLFMFFYSLGGMAVLGGIVLGSSQYILGKGSWYFMLIPAGLLLIGFFYFAGLIGKSRAEEQMRELKSFVETATGEAIFHDQELSSSISTS